MYLTKKINKLFVAFLMLSTVYTQDVLLSLDGGNMNYESTSDIAGFQFNHNGCVTGLASGGDAEAAGFTNSASGTAVLGFSFSGAVVAAGTGTLLILEGDVNQGCMSDFVFSGAGGTALSVDWAAAPSVCGDGSCDDDEDCSICPEDCGECEEADIELSFTSYSNGTLEVSMTNSVDVSGFQFDIISTELADLTITDAYGGSAGETFNTLQANGGRVLGFSLSGAVIPAGSGTLVFLDISFTGDSGIIEFDAVQFSDPNANPYVVNAGPGIDITSDPTASVQVIHNSASPTVDIYIDGALTVEGFEYRSATPVISLPTSFTVGIAATGSSEILAEFPFELMENGSYVVVATGLLENETTPFALAASETTFGADADNVGLNVYHGSTDAPAVDIYANDAVLLSDFSYGSFSGYVSVPAAEYTLSVAPTGSSVIAEFSAPLSGLGGGSATVFASGFLTPGDSEPGFGLFAALTDGTVLELSPVVLPYYNVDLVETGEYQLVILQDVITSLAVGDEVGIFDANGVVESCDPASGCSDVSYGEVLVGSGVWTGSQLEISAVMSADLSDFGGPVLNGAIEDNPVKIKVWKTQEQEEWDVEATWAAGNGDFGDFILAASELTFTALDIYDNIEMPTSFELMDAYPNPFNPITTINFSIPFATEVKVSIFDMLGREVSILSNELLQVGSHSINWNASAMPSGFYFIHMVSNDFKSTQKITLIK